jgi:hypothetical protein
MVLQTKDVRRHFFSRLHNLQALYADGKIVRGSPEHSEILALEELESLFVKQQMEKLYGVQLKLQALTRQNVVSVSF